MLHSQAEIYKIEDLSEKYHALKNNDLDGLWQTLIAQILKSFLQQNNKIKKDDIQNTYMNTFIPFGGSP